MKAAGYATSTTFFSTQSFKIYLCQRLNDDAKVSLQSKATTAVHMHRTSSYPSGK